MLGEELGQNERRGVVNHIADVKLLQGDVAESWREQGQDYATVALRFGLRDWTTDKATGAVVEGDPGRPIEATELWTFVRPRGGEWLCRRSSRARSDLRMAGEAGRSARPVPHGQPHVPLARGADVGRAVAVADQGPGFAVIGQRVQAELLGQVAADTHAAHAVAARIQQRREHADAELARPGPP